MFSPGGLCCMSIVLLLSGASAGKEYFSSIAGLEELLDTEAFLLDHLQSYVESMTSQLDMLKGEIRDIQREHQLASGGMEEYLTNPVNAYLLIKRLDKDWGIYEDTVEYDISRKSFLEAISFSRKNMSYPSNADAAESAIALVRLQETYQLDVSQLAAGVLNGVKYGSAMSWQDCFQLGQQLFFMKDFIHTRPWLKESLELLLIDDLNNNTDTVDLLEVVANYHREMGDFEAALNITNKVIELDSTRSDLGEFQVYLREMIAQGPMPEEEIVEKTEFRHYRSTNEFKLYEQVCRGEIKQEPWEENPLRCSYYHNNVPYRYLMPFKMEEMNLEPRVVVFHDVLSDDEIVPIKEIAKPAMARSQVRTVDGGSSMTSSYRTSQSTWLKYNIHPAVQRLQARLRDITGLNMMGNEDLQVANYGIGGHYEPHFDFFESDKAFTTRAGNRISTSIFYLSDVEQGGATAFPFLKRAVQPRKGSMMFWYNLHRSEEKDFRTKHAACPVLKGSKWIANVWTRVRGQEFLRPCGLQPDHEVSLIYEHVQ